MNETDAMTIATLKLDVMMLEEEVARLEAELAEMAEQHVRQLSKLGYEPPVQIERAGGGGGCPCSVGQP